MTHTRRIIALLALVLVSATAFAAPPVKYYNDPVTACEQDRNLDRTLRHLSRDGFELQSVDQQPVYYLIAPTGDHAWGSVQYTLTKKTGGEYSLETDYAVVTAEVSYFDGLGYRVTKVTTELTTVY